MNLFYAFAGALFLGACVSNKISKTVGVYSKLNGTFNCPSYKNGDIKTGGVDIKAYTFSQEFKDINGVVVVVTKMLTGGKEGQSKTPSINMVDGQWHIKEFVTERGEMLSKKALVVVYLR